MREHLTTCERIRTAHPLSLIPENPLKKTSSHPGRWLTTGALALCAPYLAFHYYLQPDMWTNIAGSVAVGRVLLIVATSASVALAIVTWKALASPRPLLGVTPRFDPARPDDPDNGTFVVEVRAVAHATGARAEDSARSTIASATLAFPHELAEATISRTADQDVSTSALEQGADDIAADDAIAVKKTLPVVRRKPGISPAIKGMALDNIHPPMAVFSHFPGDEDNECATSAAAMCRVDWHEPSEDSPDEPTRSMLSPKDPPVLAHLHEPVAATFKKGGLLAAVGSLRAALSSATLHLPDDLKPRQLIVGGLSDADSSALIHHAFLVGDKECEAAFSRDEVIYLDQAGGSYHLTGVTGAAVFATQYVTRKCESCAVISSMTKSEAEIFVVTPPHRQKTGQDVPESMEEETRG